MMARAPFDISPFVSAFETVRGDLPGSDWVPRLRAGAIERFAALGLPGRKAEEWRYTDLKPLNDRAFAPANDRGAIDPEALAALRIDEADGPLLVFVDGMLDHGASQIADLPAGVSVKSFADALSDDDGEGDGQARAALEDLSDTDALAQLNTAMMRDGAIIEIADGAGVDRPIQIVHHAAGGDGAAAHIRNLIRLGDGASAKIVETYAGGDGATMTNAVTQIALAKDAALELATRQRQGPNALHIAKTVARLGRNARLSASALAYGGRSARHELRVTVAEEGAHIAFAGVQLAAPRQSLDLLTHFDHAVGGAISDQAYRGVLQARARASFQGKVLVRRDAQLTDAQQQSDSLLLARTAEANAKPELEIYADDVKCAHGSTVGELSADQIFYLTARGVAPEEAKALLTEAFVTQVLDRIAIAPVRAAFVAEARDWLRRAVREQE